VHVPKGREKKIQRALMQYREPQNRGLVIEGLRMAGRSDLIGSRKKCLVAGEKCGDRYRPGPAARWKRTGRLDPGHDPGSTSKKVPKGE
ncbi:DUF3362 domain-containing protein, partial [Methanoregula sp.]